MTTEEREVIACAIAGIDTALTWLEADLRRLQHALDHGVSLEVIGALNRIAMQARERT